MSTIKKSFKKCLWESLYIVYSTYWGMLLYQANWNHEWGFARNRCQEESFHLKTCMTSSFLWTNVDLWFGPLNQYFAIKLSSYDLMMLTYLIVIFNSEIKILFSVNKVDLDGYSGAIYFSWKATSFCVACTYGLFHPLGRIIKWNKTKTFFFIMGFQELEKKE